MRRGEVTGQRRDFTDSTSARKLRLTSSVINYIKSMINHASLIIMRIVFYFHVLIQNH